MGVLHKQRDYVVQNNDNLHLPPQRSPLAVLFERQPWYLQALRDKGVMSECSGR